MAPSARMRLEAALARWRRTRAPVDAAGIDAHAAEALAGWSAPVADSDRAFQRAWLAAVPDPVGRAWALDTVLAQLPGDNAAQRSGALAKRVETLARFGPDPRFASAIDRIGGWVQGWISARLRAAIARLQASSELDPTADVQVVRELPAPSPDIEALWREVYASPDDDAPLTVLADAL